jgi:hypothetical protein
VDDDLRLHVLVPKQAVIGTRHQLRLADAVQQGDDGYPAVLDVYDFNRSRRHLLDDDRLRLETRRKLKRIVADHSVRPRDRGQRQRNGCNDFLHGRAQRPSFETTVTDASKLKRKGSSWLFFRERRRCEHFPRTVIF